MGSLVLSLITLAALAACAYWFSGVARTSRGMRWGERFQYLAVRGEYGALVYDLADMQELQGYTRGIQRELEANQFVLRQFLPNDNIDDIEYRATKGNLRDQDAAKVRSWDTESPIGDRQGISRIMGELPPISKKIPLTEEQRLRMRALERGNNQQIVDAIFGDAANMARAVVARVEMLRGEALSQGSISINENGVKQTIDFGRAVAHTPATLAGANQFTDPASPAVDILTADIAVYLATNGVRPALGLTSTRVINGLLRNTQIRTLLGSLAGAPALVTNAQLNQVLQAFNLPPLVAYDVSVRVDGVQTRILDDRDVIFLPPAGEPVGATFFGTTAEALELASAQQISNDQAPGLVAVVDKTFDPVHTWTKATCISLPVLVNPDLTFRHRVIT